MVKRLTFPAPYKEPVRTERGWAAIPWTPEGIIRVIISGGWFSPEPEAHVFERGARGYALNCQDIYAFIAEVPK